MHQKIDVSKENEDKFSEDKGLQVDIIVMDSDQNASWKATFIYPLHKEMAREYEESPNALGIQQKLSLVADTIVVKHVAWEWSVVDTDKVKTLIKQDNKVIH